MVSYPFFDANIFSTENFSREYSKLEKSANNPLLNRAINASYPPASTFKVIMSTAMLAEDAMPSTKEIECKGYLDYGGRTFKCHVGIPGHGHLDLKNATAFNDIDCTYENRENSAFGLVLGEKTNSD